MTRRQLAEIAARLRDTVAAGDPGDLAMAQMRQELARALVQLGAADEAVVHARLARDTFVELHGRDNVRTTRACLTLAEALFDAGEPEEATFEAEAVINRHRRQPQSEHAVAATLLIAEICGDAATLARLATPYQPLRAWTALAERQLADGDAVAARATLERITTVMAAHLDLHIAARVHALASRLRLRPLQRATSPDGPQPAPAVSARGWATVVICALLFLGWLRYCSR